MNRIVLLGRLAADPEVKYTNSGKAVCQFTLAVNRPAKDAGADFIPVVAWDKLAETIGNNLSKGRRALIEGRLSTRTYEDKQGQKKKVYEVVASNMEFVDAKEQKQEADFSNMGQQQEVPFDVNMPF